MKIRGVNLGNWLVLEKWMSPQLFEGTTAADEYYLAQQLPHDIFEARIRTHRNEYISDRDFARIASWGLNAVRIPVPYFIFGDRPPFIGCIEELDRAFDWAEHYGIKILIDLHTVPMSQNGYDNGGISGVCKWAQMPDEVEFVLTVLERLAERYGRREGLFGIEPLNEPAMKESGIWETMNVPERYPAVDKKLAEGSGPIPQAFLRDFYTRAYERIRKYMPADKYVVFHDGFKADAWYDFMQDREQYPGVILDTHQYLMEAELKGCEQSVPGYLKYIEEQYIPLMEETAKHFTTICGEWCLFNSAACGHDTKGGQSVLNGVTGEDAVSMTEAKRKSIYNALAQAQKDAWERGAGWFYWTYKMLTDTSTDPGWYGWDCWDLGRSVDAGWFPVMAEKLD
jgi:aryl-phospho-beta-D-glucosidase BglC (GH1 family)